MTFTFELIINPIVLIAVAIVAALFGFLAGRKRLAKSRSRILQLEDEMMSSHAEILEIQKAYVKMESRLKELSIPVIPINVNTKDGSKEKFSK